MEYNQILPLNLRMRLNKQKNKMKLEGKVDSRGVILQPYRYVIGLGERHFRSFMKEIDRICDIYPWTKKKHIRFIMHELVLNSQCSMLRECMRKVAANRKAAGYFHITIFICNGFFSASIEEFGDFFDYFGYISHLSEDHYLAEYYDEMQEHTVSLDELARDKSKIVLDLDNELVVPDGSNKIGLDIIENATDHDFYITSFYKNNKYMWKRIYFRVENSGK
jgi:hypothetical protein